jgi:predicted dehydrogenase
MSTANPKQIKKVAVIGCGLISSKKYLPIFAKNKRTKLVAVCDLDKEQVKKAALKFGAPKAYLDVSRMLTQERPDIVAIATPPQTHAKITIEALTKGAHVLVEKPMATEVSDCDQMIKTAEKCGKKLGVMHNQIFNPAFEKARRLMEQKQAGKFLGMRILLATFTDFMTSQKDHWAHKLPGGVVGETGPHVVYLTLALLKKIDKIHIQPQKQLSQYPWSIGEDFRINFVGGNITSSITLVYGSKQTAAEIDIFTSQSLLKIDLQSRLLIKQNRPNVAAKTIAFSALGNIWQASSGFISNIFSFLFSRNLDGHFRGITRFLDYVDGKTDYPATGKQGREVVAVMKRLVQELNKELGK